MIKSMNDVGSQHGIRSFSQCMRQCLTHFIITRFIAELISERDKKPSTMMMWHHSGAANISPMERTARTPLDH